MAKSKEEARDIACAAVKALAERKGKNVTFSFDVIWEYAEGEVPSTSRPIMSRKHCQKRTRRIKEVLGKDGVKIGRGKVRSILAEENLKAIQPRAFKPKTTDSKGTTAAPNLVTSINFSECAPQKIIIGDITYIRLRSGRFCYLAVWQDKVTRRIIGWSLALEMTADLVISALEKAIRKGLIQAGAIVHSDRGSQYASIAFRELLRRNGFRQSMSGKGNCYDNAQAESFFSDSKPS